MLSIISEILTIRQNNNGGYPPIPWKELLLWTLYSYANTSAGLRSLSRLAKQRVDNYTEKRMTEVAFRHIMGLSMDFHSNKNTGEILQAVYNAHALNDLIDVVFFTLAPAILDLGVAIIYISNLLDAYAGFVVLITTVCYLWITIASASWTNNIRREGRAKAREKNRRLYEPVSNWLTVAYFDRNQYEGERLSECITEEQKRWIKYTYLATLVSAIRGLLMVFGLLTVSILAVWRISLGIA